MKKLGLALTLAVASASALVLVSAVTASSTAKKQSVAIEVKTTTEPGATGTSVLTPVGRNPLKPDSGKFTFTASQKQVVRNGQSVTIFSTAQTLVGKQGTMVVKGRYDDVAAGSSYRVGTGPWSLVRAKGTGQYANVHGSGGSAYVLVPPRRIVFRFEGSVTGS